MDEVRRITALVVIMTVVAVIIGGVAISTLYNTAFAEPLHRALSGRSGTMVGLDFRGVEVLAAYEPVAELDLGLRYP